jgi:short-subunit dehydrogenase
MRNQKEGLIINVTSLGAIVTYPFLSLYHATKFAVEGLTESMRYELNPLGITLKLVEPGGYQTDFVSRSLVVSNLGQPKEYQTAFSQFTKRLTTGSSNPNLSEVAEVIYAAATDGTDQFRYPAGADAVQLIALKKQMKDSDFKDMIASQMGL